MNILITGIGGPTPRSIALQIRRAYPQVRIVGVDSNTKALGFYMNGLVDKYFIIPKAKEKELYWSKIKSILVDENITLAFVQPEAEVLEWNNYKEINGDYPCPVLIPPKEHTIALVDKLKMAKLLEDTTYIPRTLGVTPQNPQFNEVENLVGYPCWIRASVGSGGLGSLKLQRKEDLEAWLFIHSKVPSFTVSEFLPGKHLANQMLYFKGKLIKNAGLQCVEYVMADIAPSKVTGNTSFGRLLNDDSLLSFCEEVMEYIGQKTGVKPHGVYSFDLKEDKQENFKVTEINVRHMAYTGIMSQCGFDLVSDTIKFLTHSPQKIIEGHFKFENEYVFLRDVDIEPIILTEDQLLKITK